MTHILIDTQRPLPVWLLSHFAFRPFACMCAIVMIALAPPAAIAQQMHYNVSVYSDASVSSDLKTVYGTSTTVDNSTGCGHSNYQTRAQIITSHGTFSGSGTMTANASASTNGALTDFVIQGTVNFNCSCFGPVGGGGPGFIVYTFDANNPTALYTAIAALEGSSEASVQSLFAASGVVNSVTSPLTPSNVNILGVGNLSGVGDAVNSVFEGYVEQMGFSFQSATTVPVAVPIAVPGLIQVVIAVGTTVAAGAVLLASCLLMDGSTPAKWDPSRYGQCEAQQAADAATCAQRFPYGTGQGSKYRACISHSWVRYTLCMKNQPVPPLQPQH